MQAALQSRLLWLLVKGDEPCPSKPSDVKPAPEMITEWKAEKREHLDWLLRDQAAQGLMKERPKVPNGCTCQKPRPQKRCGTCGKICMSQISNELMCTITSKTCTCESTSTPHRWPTTSPECLTWGKKSQQLVNYSQTFT